MTAVCSLSKAVFAPPASVAGGVFLLAFQPRNKFAPSNDGDIVKCFEFQ